MVITGVLQGLAEGGKELVRSLEVLTIKRYVCGHLSYPCLIAGFAVFARLAGITAVAGCLHLVLEVIRVEVFEYIDPFVW